MNFTYTMVADIMVRSLLFFTSMLWMGCNHDHSHGAQGHGHSHGAGGHGDGDAEHGDHGDAHGDAHGGGGVKSFTVWTKKTELFMEYDPLVAGRTSRFSAHLTTLDDFKAVTSGALYLMVELGDGTVIEEHAEAPSRPGIFRFEVDVVAAGPCKFSLSYVGPLNVDTISGGECNVHVDAHGAEHANGSEADEAGIAFTKEQQWKTEFRTIEVAPRQMRPSVQALGEIKAVSGREARITAPARGRVTIAQKIPLPGMTVKKGQLLASVSPYLAAGGDRSTLHAEAQSAKAEFIAAEAQLARMERLFGEQAVSERRVEDARAHLSVAGARRDAATGRLQQYNHGVSGLGGGGSRSAFQLRSAIDGTLVKVNATNGDSVEEGRLLFEVIDLSTIWLQASIFEPDIPKVSGARTAWFTIEGYEEPFTIDETNGRLITVGSVISPNSRTVPVIFEMENPDGRLRIGQFAKVFISTGKTREVVAVPESALLNDGGKRVVFVQAQGERFVRRVVRTGIHSKGWVEVIEGLQAKERLVTEGAYEVRLSSASGAIPEHGHVH